MTAADRRRSEVVVVAEQALLIFHRGRELGRVVGFHPRSWFDELIAAEFPELEEPEPD